MTGLLTMQAGADLDAQSHDGLTPLHVAGKAQSWSVSALLLDSGCDGSLKDAFGRSAMHCVVQTGNWTLFSLLYMYPKCIVLEPDHRGVLPPPFLLPASPDALQRHACLSSKIKGMLAYHQKSEWRRQVQLECHQPVMQNNVWPKCPSILQQSQVPFCLAGFTLLHYAVEGGSLDIVGVLLVHMQSLAGPQAAVAAPLSASLPVPGHHASPPLAATGIAGQLPQASESVPSQATSTGAGAAAAAATSQSGSSSPTSAQQEKACLSAAEGIRASESPVSGTASCGDKDGQQAAPCSLEECPCTPLHMAAYKGHAELMPYLLQAGYTASQMDEQRRTPLHYAAMQGCQPFSQLSRSDVQQPSQAHACSICTGILGCCSAPASAAQSIHAITACNDPSVVAHDCAVAAPWASLLDRRDAPSSSGSCAAASCSAQSPTSVGVRVDLDCALHGSHPSCSSCSPAPLQRGTDKTAGEKPPVPARIRLPGDAMCQWTGLMPRVRQDYAGAAELLLVGGVDSTAVDSYGCTALHYAAGML